VNGRANKGFYDLDILGRRAEVLDVGNGQFTAACEFLDAANR
jgi:hypothetical protein